MATARESQGLHARNEDVVLGDPRAAETVWASRALALSRDKPLWSSLFSCALVAKDVSIPDHAGLPSLASPLRIGLHLCKEEESPQCECHDVASEGDKSCRQ